MTITQVVIGREVDGEVAWLEPAAAASYLRMLAAGLPAGGITDAGRTSAEQEAVFLSRYTPRRTGAGPFGQVAYWRGVRYVRTSGPSSAAVPGTSTHESGRALDLQPAQEAWVRAHPDHGWRFTIASERWHTEHDLTLDQHLADIPPITTTPAPTAAQEDDMIALILTLFRRYFGVTPSDAMVLAQSDALSGMSPAQAHRAFRGAVADENAIRACYRELLGRDPSPSDLALRAGRQTLDQLWTDVAASPEAKARR